MITCETGVPLFGFYKVIYLAVCELKSPSMSDFLWGLENSGWLRHIKAIMDAGTFIAKVRDGRESKRRGRPASTLRCPARGCAAGEGGCCARLQVRRPERGFCERSVQLVYVSTAVKW